MNIVKSNIYSHGKYVKYIMIDNGVITYIGNEQPSCKGDIEDLSDRFIYPGFIDSHIHLMQYGLSLLRCDLRGAISRDEIYQRIDEFIKKHSDRTFIIAEGFDESTFNNINLPEKKVLDKICSSIPLIVRRVCGHIAIVNTAAENILRKSPYFGKTKIEDGILKEGIILHLNRVFDTSDEIKKQGLLKAQNELFSYGITSIGDMSTEETVVFLRKGILDIDVISYFPMDSINSIEKDEKIRESITGIKIFLDGAIGSYTAAMDKPFKNSNNIGDLLVSENELKELLSFAEKFDLKIAAHAIGNRAISLATDILTEGHRIEHCEIASKEVLESIKEKNIYLSMQPNFIGNWGMKGQMYERRLSDADYKFNNVCSYIDKMGIKMGFGSDNMPVSPLYGIRSTVNAEFDDQRLSPLRAMELYTKGSCDIMNIKKKGELAENAFADYVVLSESIEKISEKEIEVIMTVKNGKTVYKRRNL